MKITVEMDEKEFLEFHNYKEDKKYILANFNKLRNQLYRQCVEINGKEIYNRYLKYPLDTIEQLLFDKIEAKDK